MSVETSNKGDHTRHSERARPLGKIRADHLAVRHNMGWLQVQGPTAPPRLASLPVLGEMTGSPRTRLASHNTMANRFPASATECAAFSEATISPLPRLRPIVRSMDPSCTRQYGRLVLASSKLHRQRSDPGIRRLYRPDAPNIPGTGRPEHAASSTLGIRCSNPRLPLEARHRRSKERCCPYETKSGEQLSEPHAVYHTKDNRFSSRLGKLNYRPRKNLPNELIGRMWSRHS